MKITHIINQYGHGFKLNYEVDAGKLLQGKCVLFNEEAYFYEEWYKKLGLMGAEEAIGAEYEIGKTQDGNWFVVDGFGETSPDLENLIINYSE